MGDKRFEDRLKRIHHRHRGGPKVEILAGVGERKEATAAAMRQGTPWALLLIGGAAGYGSFHVLNDKIGLDTAMEMAASPEEALPQITELAQADMMIAGSGGMLALAAILFLYSLLRGSKSRGMHAFSFAAVAGVLGGAAAVMMQPDVIMALVETYTGFQPLG